MSDTISITGVGIVCAIGNDADSVLDSLRKGESGIRQMEYLDSRHKDLPVGEVKMSTARMKEILGIEGDRALSRTSAMGAIAVREALRQAGIGEIGSRRAVLISGTTVGVMDATESMEGLERGNECGKSTLQIAEYAGIGQARCCTISTACSSALNAIILGSEMLLRGDADIVIAGGSEALSRFHLNGFNSLMILDSRRCRPFDESRAGLNLGEGAAFVVLQKNARSGLAYVNGYSNRCDAFHQTATSEDGRGAFLAMTDAIAMSGLSAGDIQYVNAHGTATVDNDKSESVAFRRVFGDSLPEISSTKSYTGHTTSASGAIETVICVLAMQNGFIPRSLGWTSSDSGGIIPSPGRENVHLENVMCNSFGFGGNDSSLILGKSPHRGPSRDAVCCSGCTVASKVTVSSEEQLKSLNEYMSPMESRRMCKLMKAGMLSAFAALKEAGISCPDAIITATSKGMVQTSTLFLKDIVSNSEESLSPTLFMQSTHNTLGSAIAIKTRCHGYNTTYSHGEQSAEWALYDARRLIMYQGARSVLVCSFDETIENCQTGSFFAESMTIVARQP